MFSLVKIWRFFYSYFTEELRPIPPTLNWDTAALVFFSLEQVDIQRRFSPSCCSTTPFSFSLSWNLGVRLWALNWWCSSMQLLQRNKTNNSLSCASFFRWIGGKTDIRRDFITCSLVCNWATGCVVTQSFSPVTGLWGGSLRDVTTTAV